MPKTSQKATKFDNFINYTIIYDIADRMIALRVECAGRKVRTPLALCASKQVPANGWAICEV